jgi:hypothetical protein
MKTSYLLLITVVLLVHSAWTIYPSLVDHQEYDQRLGRQQLTCSNLMDYMDECNEEFMTSDSDHYHWTVTKGSKSCPNRIPFCFKKRMEMGAIKMDAPLARCIDNFKYGYDCNATSIYDKCCRLPFQESGGCPPINYGGCEFTTCNPFGVQCNSAFRCVAPVGFACDVDSDCISGLYCTNCICSTSPPIGPPTVIPIAPPIVEPIAPPTVEPIAPPVSPEVPQVNCTNDIEATGLLEQCQINCGSGCSICGQVWTYCVENGFISANYTISACLTIVLDNIPTSLGLCPFSDSILECCDNPIPPVTPPVEPPVLPPIPLPPQAQLNCTDNNEVAYLLGICQVACGTGCQYCGEVFSYCEENGIFGSNYTLDTCMTVTLDYLPVSSGCPYNASLNTCCGIPPPPPNVDCTVDGNNDIAALLAQCQTDCGSSCQYCGEVFSFCEEQGYFTSNFTVDNCMTVTLDYLPVSSGCPYNASLSSCCGFPPPPPVVCINNTAVEETLIACQLECGTDCPFCGDVFSYCVLNGNVSVNFTLNTCLTVTLDYIPTGLGICPFNTSLTSCCDSPVPPIAPPVVPPVAPDVPILTCQANVTDFLLALETCQVDCGAACTLCGQVYTFCLTTGAISSNFTLDACLITTLDGLPVSGVCPYALSVEACCTTFCPPDLSGLVIFGILASTTVTSAGLTTVTGAVGVNPGTSITGPIVASGGVFTPPSATLTTATATLASAYTELVATPCGAIPLPGIITTLVLTPGVYCTPTSLAIGTSLTLDAEGDPNAVFIIKVPTTLTTASASSILLINGALPGNVFFQVGASATMGTSSTFVGNLLAQVSITATTGAGIVGRLLAVSGAVTVDTNIIVAPEVIPCPPIVTPIAPPVVAPIAPEVPLVDCLDNLEIVGILDACQVACGAGCDYCGQVFSYCMENSFILANYTLDACNVIYLDFIPTSAGDCPFNDTLTFCCGEVQPPVPVIPTAVPVTPPPTPVVDCLDNPTVVTVLDACQTLCGAECDYCGQVYTYCSDTGLLIGNFTFDACLVINLDFIPTSVGACPFNDTLTACCSEVEPPVPILRNQENKHYQQKKLNWDESKCSLYKYTEAYYCMKAYNNLSCEDRLVKCKDYVIKSVENDESKHCLMNRISHSSDSETCHFEKAITDCCA